MPHRLCSCLLAFNPLIVFLCLFCKEKRAPNVTKWNEDSERLNLHWFHGRESIPAGPHETLHQPRSLQSRAGCAFCHESTDSHFIATLNHFIPKPSAPGISTQRFLPRHLPCGIPSQALRLRRFHLLKPNIRKSLLWPCCLFKGQWEADGKMPTMCLIPAILRWPSAWRKGTSWALA